MSSSSQSLLWGLISVGLCVQLRCILEVQHALVVPLVKLPLLLASLCLFCKDLFLYDAENVTTMIPSVHFFHRGVPVRFNTRVVPVSQSGTLKPASFFSSVLGGNFILSGDCCPSGKEKDSQTQTSCYEAKGLMWTLCVRTLGETATQGKG